MQTPGKAVCGISCAGLIVQGRAPNDWRRFCVQGGFAMDADAQAQANAMLRQLSGPQARSAMSAMAGLSDAQIAGLLAGNVDAAQLVNSIVNGSSPPSMPAPPRQPSRCATCPVRLHSVSQGQD